MSNQNFPIFAFSAARGLRRLVNRGLALAAVISFSVCGALQGVQAADEKELLTVLQSDSSPQEKDAACVELKRIGSAHAVPALAKLLTDEQLSHSARYALESMPAPEAGKALTEALDQTTGSVQAGIAESLGERREAKAAEKLGKLLASSDATVAAAAAWSLGRIGEPQTVKALEAALEKADKAPRGAILNALLMVANRNLENGGRGDAFAIFERLYKTDAPEQVRAAAYRGMIRSGGDRAMALLIDGIKGAEGPSQLAALQMAHEIEDPAAVSALCKLLPESSPVVQIALIEALSQRGDPAAAPAVIAASVLPDVPVRLAAVCALGHLGDPGEAGPGAGLVARLAMAASATDGEEKKAGRQSLLDLKGGKTADELLEQLAAAGGDRIQPEIAHALAARNEKGAVPKLIALARTDPAGHEAAMCKAVFQALASLADASQIPALTQIVLEAQNEAARDGACKTLAAVCQRLQSSGGRPDVGPIVAGLTSGSPEARAALLQTCSALVDERIRAAVRAALAGSDAGLRDAATRALTDTLDAELMPDLLAMAKGAKQPETRVMAVRGYLRLAGEQGNSKLSPEQRVEAIKQVLPLAQTPEEKWLALSKLSAVPHPEALQIALDMLKDPETQNEAAQAVTALATALKRNQTQLARGALQKVVASSANPQQREAAQQILSQMNAGAGSIVAWEVAGPYLQEGKDCQALFDIAFPPEKPDAKGVTWVGARASGKGDEPRVVDLLQIFNGDQRIAYARTRVFSEKKQPARLELGVDDGAKVWLNGKVVHAINRRGPLEPGAEKAAITLNQGWNTLLLKISQDAMGWQFCVRLAKPDGTPIEGIRFDEALMRKPAARRAPQSAEPKKPVQPVVLSGEFERRQVDADFRSEGVAVADFNRDGKLDIATGNLIYYGPDWKAAPMLATPQKYNPEAYSNEFLCFAEDIDKDKWTDLIVVGFPGAKTRWLKNPGKKGGVWPEYVAIEKTGNESPDWVDVDKDGREELLFTSEHGVAFAQPGKDPTQPWDVCVIANAGDPSPGGHGLGVGDVNGDGRNDVVCPDGWWEAPKDSKATPWTFHKAKLSDNPAQMVVFDIDGDGDADIASSSAHNYGFWWYEQTPDGWKKQNIDNTISELHALHLADINRDGLPDLVTGKRFWAHRHGDPGTDDPSVLAWFELQRKDGQVKWIRHNIDDNSGVGLHFVIIDLNGDKLLDIVTSNKKGVYTFTQKNKKPKRSRS